MTIGRCRKRVRKLIFSRFPQFSCRVACTGFILGLYSISLGQAVRLNPKDPIEPFDNFGVSVAIDGNTIAVSKNGDNEGGLSAGAAYIFEAEPEESNNWVQQAKPGVHLEAFPRSGREDSSGQEIRLEAGDGRP